MRGVIFGSTCHSSNADILIYSPYFLHVSIPNLVLRKLVREFRSIRNLLFRKRLREFKSIPDLGLYKLGREALSGIQLDPQFGTSRTSL